MVYAKLFTSIYQGTLRGDSRGLLVFTNLLAHADKDGVVDIHPRAIAEEVGLTVDEVRQTLLMLESPDDESRSPEEQGRRIIRLDEHRAWGWTIVNYVKYRAIRNEEDRREQNRLAQERWRNKHKSASVSRAKPQSAHTEADTEAKKERTSPSAPFSLFWEAWPKHPRKVARRQCEAKWSSLKLDLIANQVMAGLEAAKRSNGWKEDGGKFVPAPLTWLNQSRWEAPAEQDSQPENAQLGETQAWLEEQRRAREQAMTPAAQEARRRAMEALGR